ncbi:hypothetical protein DL93DRAFT_442488 [Clavulina sp. PMI_390]|nr:hypothetical protein DL93DRAFT_442488 [Clavulina sp. PMI_390]
MGPNVVEYVGKPGHWTCTGAALETTKKHSEPAEITFFSMPYSDTSQRVWTALEYLEIPYQYYGTNTRLRPPELIAISPRCLVPALRLNQFSPPSGLHESTAIIEYLNELSSTKGNNKSLFPPLEFSLSRALIRIQGDVIIRSIFPAFYRYIQCQEADLQASLLQEFLDGIERLIQLFQRAENEREDGAPKIGMWQEEGTLSFADVLVVPTLFRSKLVLGHYRNFSFDPLLAKYPRFQGYLDRLLGHPAFKATCNTDDVLLDCYEMFAFNLCRNQRATAVIEGRELP